MPFATIVFKSKTPFVKNGVLTPNGNNFPFIMAIAMVAMLAFGGTYAYFTATASAKTATIKTGKVVLTNNSAYDFTATLDGVMPGDTIFEAKALSFSTADSTGDTYIAFTVSIKIDNVEKTVEELETFGIKLDFDDVWTLTQDKSAYVKTTKTAANATVYLNSEAIKFEAKENNQDNSNSLVVMGKTITIAFAGYSIQAANLTSTQTASADSLWLAISDAVEENQA
ncbi:MAG: hypothetical protein J6Q13_02340 [Clostridia bacterium]|nr:hypothetical protein [Clostridia bacterium]